MFRANVIKTTLIDGSRKSELEYFSNLNHALVEISETELKFDLDKKSTVFPLHFFEEDMATKSYSSRTERGDKFRVVKPTEANRKINALKDPVFKDGFTIGSLEPDGYSILFTLTDKNHVINQKVEVAGAKEYIQKLVDAVNMTIEYNLSNDFVNLSKRLIGLLQSNSDSIKNYKNHQVAKEVINNNVEAFDDLEQRIISQRV